MMPLTSSVPKIASSRAISSSWNSCWRAGEPLARIERTAAALNAIPMTPSTTDGMPALVFGTRPNSETASALLNVSSAAEVRTCRMTAGPSSVPRRGVTDSATNSRPVSVAAEPAIATKSSR